MSDINNNIKGLTDNEVISSREKFGYNRLEFKKQNSFISAVKNLLMEPMVILLLIASTVYFISGNIGDGIFLMAAIVLVAAISLYQDSRSKNALEKLKDFTKPFCKVIRNGKTQEIKSEELVVGDFLMVEEGTSIAADGVIIQSNDFSTNESTLTGESFPVFKDQTKENNNIYQGTSVSSGLAIAEISAIGNKTKLGKIGSSLESIKNEKTPLESQIENFVKKMVIAGAIIFIIVWAINYINSNNFLDSLLKALTLAMSILPEEIPVAFTTFMALGSWRLMKLGVVVKQMKTVETLGSATVICTDKTGTITENKMSLARIYIHSTNSISSPEQFIDKNEKDLISVAMWASEPIPFDPMEIALHQAYSNLAQDDERPYFKMEHEYPLGGKPPMMTHIFKNESGIQIIAAKGAPEALIKTSTLSETEVSHINEAIIKLASDGFRVLGVGKATLTGDSYPKTQQEINFQFLGLVAFYDPPKNNIRGVLEKFYNAGIKVKIVTGDNPETTTAIAKQIEFRNYEKCITGDMLMKISDSKLSSVVSETYVFSRMYPEAKLRIIDALKKENEIVAMTGDGVNDGPALKAAHIGIAMGKKGTEIAKQAASLILIHDDLAQMVEAIAMGRRIYANLKKAIQYIISIHIPIILTVFIPLALGWIYPNIFSPIHIIFFELIMSPTCSIIYENEPMEKNTMIQKPRQFSATFFNWKELTTSIIQGLMITAGTLITYQLSIYLNYNENITRTMVFTALISSNIFLTLVNRSFYYSIFTTLQYKNNLVKIIILLTFTITALIIYIKPLADFFHLESLSIMQLFISSIIGFIFVIWYEVVKWKNRISKNQFTL